MKNQTTNINDFNAIALRVASPEQIRSWSYGEVTKPETINYRTQRAEKNGLFDEKIFGPTRDFECFCGKYKGIRYKGVVCDRCGVEVTRNIVRRERGGHIELASPVAHIWFLRSIPSRIATMLGLGMAEVEKVVYFAAYIITEVHENERLRILKEIDSEFVAKTKSAANDEEKTRLKNRLAEVKSELQHITSGQVIDDATYHTFSIKYGTVFEASVGAEAIYDMLKKIDLEQLIADLTVSREKAPATERIKINKRLSLAQQLHRSKQRPEWMLLTTIPVLPPALRPMVALEGGRHATSDLNDLYRRVINRNNRLKKLIDIKAPEVILRNEKRILQEAVDALMDNSIRRGGGSTPMSAAQRRPLKSVADYLKGKQGYFRQNLLGKRVDYSARSVIVVGPELSLDECGIPKHMALELFRPFIIAKLIERELAFNVRGAGRLIEEAVPEVWAILEEVIEGKYVLLNRAPTLHRLGIQAFKPKLIEGNAIRIHPLVCSAFNADFDGDQMAVHVPLSPEAQLEAKNFMSAYHNILKPGNGEPVVSMAQDIVLGCFWMTKEVARSEDKAMQYFSSPNEAISAYDYGRVDFREKVLVLGTDSEKYTEFNGKPFETTVGRLLFNSVLPKDYPYLNEVMKKSTLVKLINNLISHYSLEDIPVIVDKIKNFGFKYATYSGVTMSLSDIQTPQEKAAIITKAKAEVDTIRSQYDEGLLSREERKRMVIEVWHRAKSEVEKAIPDTIDPNGSVHDLVMSGARGSMGQLTQMVGMKGLIQNTARETIEFPIIASYKEGLTPIEYFTTTHGSRSGLADTALNTAKAGYLTRKLFDVAQDAIVMGEDCGTTKSVKIDRVNAFGLETDFMKNIRGRYIAEDVVVDGETIAEKGTFLTLELAEKIDVSGVPHLLVRSPMTCESKYGICQKCYGADVTTWETVDVGEAVGTVAAQAIGEPGTQLTMNMKHQHGAAGEADVVQGLPRVEELFERRSPKNPAIVSPISGIVSEIRHEGGEHIVTILPDEEYKKKGKVFQYSIYHPRLVVVSEGQKVQKGDFLSDGSADLTELHKLAGREKTQEYIIAETNKIYELQGVTISRKHMEVIIRQMFSRRKIVDAGETHLAVGDVVEEWQLSEANDNAVAEGKDIAKGETQILGIMEVSLTRRSWLSASSFQNTTRVLIGNALRGTRDPLRGLKENVIIGRVIPAGTGYEGSRKYEAITALTNKLRAEDMHKRAEMARDDENVSGVVID
jgi:DNA-directed RNA polymerase subunit beta'